MTKVIKRTGFDRRKPFERRKAYDIRYFAYGGSERRTRSDRRTALERRDDWIRVTEWQSVPVKIYAIGPSKKPVEGEHPLRATG